MRALPVLVVVVLAACASDPAPPSAPDAPPASVVETPRPDTPALAPDSREWTTEPVDVPASGGAQAVLVDVRAATHDGFDRVVFEFEADRPAARVAVAPQPVIACGSGDDVPLPGDAALTVQFSPARAHTEAGEPTAAPRRRELGLPAVLALASTCDFEGEVSWAAGTAGSPAFRVTTLADPARVVVDVQHPTE